MPVRYAAVRSRGLEGRSGRLSAGNLLMAVRGILALALTAGTLIAPRPSC